jgi:RimJ/RimL family protein N-acetyltransferase
VCWQRLIRQSGEVGPPAQPVVLSPLTKDLAALAAGWFIGDEEGRRRLDSDFYGADLKWWRLVQHDAARYGWVGLLDGEPIGFLDLEIESERAGVAIYVRREFRRRGIGKQLLRLAAVEGRYLGVPELVGSAERDNVASMRCLMAAGFTEAGADELGPLFRLHLSDA